MRPIDADDFEKDLHKLIDIAVRRGDMTMNSMLSLMYTLLKMRPTITMKKENPNE